MMVLRNIMLIPNATRIRLIYTMKEMSIRNNTRQRMEVELKAVQGVMDISSRLYFMVEARR